MSRYTNIEIAKAWSNYYSIANSEGVRCGDMICDKCKKKIRGNYLIRERQNHLLRGNENDERYLYHRECSNDNYKWVEFDKEQKEIDAAVKLRKKQIKEVKALIEKYALDADDLFDIDYNY